MTTLYNCHTDGDEWRITKFVDGNPESSYLTTHHECQCPAGSRPTCRHRQMLPAFLDRGIVDTHLFLNWDHPERPTCQFDGMIDPVPAVFAKDYNETPTPNEPVKVRISLPAAAWRRL